MVKYIVQYIGIKEDIVHTIYLKIWTFFFFFTSNDLWSNLLSLVLTEIAMTGLLGEKEIREVQSF